jgi:hypothetical protein
LFDNFKYIEKAINDALKEALIGQIIPGVLTMSIGYNAPYALNVILSKYPNNDPELNFMSIGNVLMLMNPEKRAQIPYVSIFPLDQKEFQKQILSPVLNKVYCNSSPALKLDLLQRILFSTDFTSLDRENLVTLIKGSCNMQTGARKV